MPPYEMDAIDTEIEAKMNEIYGSDDQPTEDAAGEEPETEVLKEEATEGVEEPEEETEKEETEEESTDEEETDESEDVTEAELSLAEIASIFGADESNFAIDDDGKVVFNAKIDGVNSQINAAEALKSYQLTGHLNTQNMEAVEERKAIEVERAALNEDHNNKVQILENNLQLAFNELNRDYQAVNWETLRATSPSEYLLLKQDYEERQRGLQGNLQHITDNRAQQQQDAELQRSEALQAETLSIRSAIPGWETDEGYAEGAQSVRTQMLNEGFSNEEIQSISNGVSVSPSVATKIISIAHKAAQYDKLQEAQTQAIKKVRAAPKIVSTRNATAQEAQTSLSKAVAGVSKTGEVSDAYLKAKGLF